VTRVVNRMALIKTARSTVAIATMAKQCSGMIVEIRVLSVFDKILVDPK